MCNITYTQTGIFNVQMWKKKLILSWNIFFKHFNAIYLIMNIDIEFNLEIKKYYATSA